MLRVAWAFKLFWCGRHYESLSETGKLLANVVIGGPHLILLREPGRLSRRGRLQSITVVRRSTRRHVVGEPQRTANLFRAQFSGLTDSATLMRGGHGGYLLIKGHGIGRGYG